MADSNYKHSLGRSLINLFPTFFQPLQRRWRKAPALDYSSLFIFFPHSHRLSGFSSQPPGIVSTPPHVTGSTHMTLTYGEYDLNHGMEIGWTALKWLVSKWMSDDASIFFCVVGWGTWNLLLLGTTWNKTDQSESQKVPAVRFLPTPPSRKKAAVSQLRPSYLLSVRGEPPHLITWL